MQITLGDIHMNKKLGSNSSQRQKSIREEWDGCLLQSQAAFTGLEKSYLVSSDSFQTHQVIHLALQFSLPRIYGMSYCLSWHFKVFAGIVYIAVSIYLVLK